MSRKEPGKKKKTKLGLQSPSPCTTSDKSTTSPKLRVGATSNISKHFSFQNTCISEPSLTARCLKNTAISFALASLPAMWESLHCSEGPQLCLITATSLQSSEPEARGIAKWEIRTMHRSRLLLSGHITLFLNYIHKHMHCLFRSILTMPFITHITAGSPPCWFTSINGKNAPHIYHNFLLVSTINQRAPSW